MPVNYRAGAAYPHGHALLQLIHEASAGIPVHQHGVDQMDDAHHGGDIATAHAGAPTIQIFAASALLPLLLLALWLLTTRTSVRPYSEDRHAEWRRAPAHPPPRHGRACLALP